MTTLTTRQFATRAALDAALEERLAQAIAAAGPSAIMLSGGQTPLPAYRALASRALASRAAGSGASGRDPLRHDSGLRIVFSDDRYVPADSESSNYHQSRPLLDALALSAGAVLRVRTELPLEDAAADYERQLAALIAAGVPVRLGLLGLGADGHTASLFSTADLERARGRLAIAVHRPDGLSAVSVTPEFLTRIVEPVFVIAGQGKDAAISRLMAQDPQLIAWRAIQRCARVEAWVLESA
jgi:6-phosphogluconolactonase